LNFEFLNEDVMLQLYNDQIFDTGKGYMPRLMKHVLDALADLGESEQVALFSIPDPARPVCRLDGGFINTEFVPPGRLFDIQGTPLEEVIRTGMPNTYPGLMRDGVPFPSFTQTDTDFECLCLPLLNEQRKLMGLAVLAQKKGFSSTDFRMRTLIMLRTLISAAMENARLFQLATTDSLTGLYLRRYFEIRLQEEIVRVRRHGGSLTVMMLDIDHFKRVNDTYGHQQGDLVLQAVARVILESIRKDIDLPCRFGGEEFILLLPSTPMTGATVLAERIRQRCEEMEVAIESQNIKITLSIGLAELSKDALVSKDELIRRADAMLYVAKSQGRNQVVEYRAELDTAA